MSVTRLPHLVRTADGYDVLLRKDGPVVGKLATGNNFHPWGWTVGLGWHTRAPSLGAALDALLADPALGVDVHGEGRRPHAENAAGGAS